MNTHNNAIDAQDEVIKAELDKIRDDATCHFFNQASVVVVKMEVRLPHGTIDNENRYFIDFIETYRRALANDRRAPFILWMRDKSQGCQSYLCGMFLNGVLMPPLDGYFKMAETLWAKTLGIPDARRLIGRCQEDYYGRPTENGIKIKRTWSEDGWVNASCHQWIISMHQRSCRVKNRKYAHLVFGAAYRSLSQ